ncbi:hypothetical protein DM02DRAFT_635460 [Periconia macrospinosa]|uniref:Uncharacterized protein n=1 Tax=Periconia macrospinosa TaxID=97972 RepID=A0A2V1D2R4_9PLEO|nr:hypothetical protein DM02DRAFT_635460 [Periconia macrospinosa]
MTKLHRSMSHRSRLRKSSYRTFPLSKRTRSLSVSVAKILMAISSILPCAYHVTTSMFAHVFTSGALRNRRMDKEEFEYMVYELEAEMEHLEQYGDVSNFWYPGSQADSTQIDRLEYEYFKMLERYTHEEPTRDDKQNRRD